MRQIAAAVILTGAACLGISGEALAQVQIMPTGPLSLKSSQDPVPVNVLLALPEEPLVDSPEQVSEVYRFYPGRTMGGGSRMLRPNPPPSFFGPRKE